MENGSTFKVSELLTVAQTPLSAIRIPHFLDRQLLASHLLPSARYPPFNHATML